MESTAKKLTNKLFGQMILCGLICGVACGAACVLFAWVTTLCDRTFHADDWLLFVLPAAGVLVVLLYDKFRAGEDLCTDALFRCLHGDPVLNKSSVSRKANLGSNQVSLWLAPLIFISTSLAYLFGGSVGRVGSALQIGGTLGIYSTGWIGASGDPAHDDRAGIFTQPGMRHVPLACGMATGFCAILNAPVAGAIFGVEVLILSGSELIAIIPSAIASFMTWGIAHLARISYVDFHFELTGGITDAGSTSDSVAMAALKETGLASEVLIKVIIVALGATLIGRMFCYGRTITAKGFEQIRIKGFSDVANKIVRVLVGTGLVLTLTLIAGVSHYNGIGFNYVDATMGGESAMLAFLWKLA
ncbi:MAG: chloride channel protein, partial [Clostridia bacterium]|nr:chloride channel protein [Clostridia bacterium]